MVESGKTSSKTSVKSRRQHDASAHGPTVDARTKRVRVSDQEPDGFSNHQFDYVTRLVRSHLDQKSPVSVSYLMSTKTFEGFSVNRLKGLVKRLKLDEKQKREIAERQCARREREDRAEEVRMARERQAEREGTSLVEAQLRRAEAMLSDNEKTIRTLETEIQLSREKEGRLNDQLDLLRGDLASQDKGICNKEAEIQALENDQLRTRHEQVPGDAVLIDKLQLELHHRQSALDDIQRVHLATANELKSKESEYKS